MSSLIFSLLIGFPSISLALKNILGVQQYSSQMMYIVQSLISSSFSYSSYLFSGPCKIITSSPSQVFTFYSSPPLTTAILFLQSAFSWTKYCFCSSKCLDLYLGFEEGFQVHPLHTSVNLSPALLNYSGDSCPFSQNWSFSGGGTKALVVSIYKPRAASFHPLNIF